MRMIERTSQFKRDYRRELKARHRTSLDAVLVPVLVGLANDQSLDSRCHDHMSQEVGRESDIDSRQANRPNTFIANGLANRRSNLLQPFKSVA